MTETKLQELLRRAAEHLDNYYKNRLAELETEYADKEMPLEVINEIGMLKDKIGEKK